VPGVAAAVVVSAAAPPAVAPPAAASASPLSARPVAALPPQTATVVAADARTRQMPLRDRPQPPSEPFVGSALRRRKRHILRWIILVLILVLAAGAGWVVYAYVLNGGVAVPGVVGRDASQAAAALRAQGFTTATHLVWSDRVDAGAVVRQRPKAGAKVNKGVNVDLWVSKGPLHIPAPALSGLTAKQAKAELERDLLTPRKRRSATLTALKGKVYRQEPAGGVTVTRGDTVTYWVSSGPPVVAVPNVVGLSSGDAKATLQGDGFTVSTDYVAGWGHYPGDVVGQDPVSGERLRKGDEVVIQVAVF
jgi:eukaryotic-like serine/threonine-protein kinase